MHEMVLGTLEELKAHAELMRKHPAMEHDEPWMAHVAPGKSATLHWQFTRAGEFHYGCLIPGHFEAGMVGRITVK
ncbi:MAG: plastocyanin/azurin family copper-binding protein [Burkholderiales bacterium]|nr:plastocyanin/azurin family copper-binding protein [Burkholderiales bacterium]